MAASLACMPQGGDAVPYGVAAGGVGVFALGSVSLPVMRRSYDAVESIISTIEDTSNEFVVVVGDESKKVVPVIVGVCVCVLLMLMQYIYMKLIRTVPSPREMLADSGMNP